MRHMSVEVLGRPRLQPESDAGMWFAFGVPPAAAIPRGTEGEGKLAS